MIKLLAKLFIKDSQNYSNPEVRRQYGVLCGGFGIFLNVLLFIAKFIFGTLAASVAMIADAFNNLSDAASSVVQILGFKLAGKKPDPDHPFGHGRIEYISGLIISFLVLLMGEELLKSSIKTLVKGSDVHGGLVPVIIMCFAILIKLYMYFYNHRIAKLIDSVAMEATAKDSFGDMISNVVVIASIIASRFTAFPVDGIGGIIVAVLILKTGFEAAKDTISPLLGVAPESSFVQEIEAELMNYKPIIGMHDLVIHDYGPGRKMISLHAEVPGNLNIFDLHEVIDQAEVSIGKKFACEVVIHMDPIDTDNVQLANLKTIVKEECHNISDELQCHDVRMVPGENNTNLIFDVVKPHGLNMSDEELRSALIKAIKARTEKISCVITIDQPYV